MGTDGQLTLRNDYRVESGLDEVRLSALGTASLDLGVDHSITVLSLFNRSLSDETSLQTGVSADYGGSYLEKWQLQYLARTLWFNQVFGDHRNLFGTRLRLRWAGFHAYGERDEPDRRTVAYGDNGGVFEWLVRSGSGERFFSNLRQDDVGGNLSLRVPLWAEAWATVGGSTQLSLRGFNNRRFRMVKNQSNTDAAAFQRPIEELLDAQSLGTTTDIREETRDNDSYESQQLLYSGAPAARDADPGTAVAGGRPAHGDPLAERRVAQPLRPAGRRRPQAHRPHRRRLPAGRRPQVPAQRRACCCGRPTA